MIVKMKQIPQILASRYRTWSGKRPDETSGLCAPAKTLLVSIRALGREKSVTG